MSVHENEHEAVHGIESDDDIHLTIAGYFSFLGLRRFLIKEIK